MVWQAPPQGVQLAFPDSSSSPCAAFNVDRFFDQLKTQTLGTTLVTSTKLPSTQEFLKDHTSVWPDGTTVFAEQQTAGKGLLL